MDPKPLSEGMLVKVILVDVISATAENPERYYHGKVVEQEKNGFWMNITRETIHPYTKYGRSPGESTERDWPEEYISFYDVADVVLETDEYPNMKDPFIRFVLEGPS